MAGGAVKYRHLSRSSAHRQALLRNLVTSLFEHESISTTWPKAKEAQRLAEKLVTLAKRNTEASKRKAYSIFYRPVQLIPKLFGPIRERYANRPGGYTRVLRIEPLKEDQAPSAILELVDGSRDMRFGLTAQTVARDRLLGRETNEITARNVKKVTQFRENGEQLLDSMVQRIRDMHIKGEQGRDVEQATKKRKVYKGVRMNRALFPDYRVGPHGPVEEHLSSFAWRTKAP